MNVRHPQGGIFIFIWFNVLILSQKSKFDLKNNSGF